MLFTIIILFNSLFMLKTALLDCGLRNLRLYRWGFTLDQTQSFRRRVMIAAANSGFFGACFSEIIWQTINIDQFEDNSL